MPRFSARSRRWLACAACLAIPALIALTPSQAVFASTSTDPTTSTTSTVTGTVSGLGLSGLAHPATTSTAQRSSSTGTTTTKSPPAQGCDAAVTAGGLCVFTSGATVTADANNGAWVSLCSLTINGSGLDYSYAGLNNSGPGLSISGQGGGSKPASNGCGSGSTTAAGNIAAALGDTAVSADGTHGVVADTCGLALALDMSNPSAASVLCGTSPGLGRTDVNQANLLALLGPAYAQLSPGGDLNADICGVAAAAGLNDATTKAAVFCETLSSAENWQAGVPGTTVSLGDNFLSADVQKTFLDASLTNGAFVTICDANVALGGNSVIDTGRQDVSVPLGSGKAPAVNCNKDANQNPIVSNGFANLTVGDTGAGGGASEAGGSGGTCGAGGGATQGSPGSTTNSCGTAPGSGPCTSACNGANAAGNLAVVLGQNNAGAGPNSGPGGSGDFGLTSNACGGGGSADPSGGHSGTDCGPPSQVAAAKTAVEGVTSPPKSNTAAAGRLASTGFPLASGILGLVLLTAGGVAARRRSEEEADVA